MPTTYSATESLTIDISKELVLLLSPEEIDLFDEISVAYFSKSSKFPVAGEKHDSLLGFGSSEIIIAITPAILAAVNTVINHIGYDLLKLGKDETIEVLEAS